MKLILRSFAFTVNEVNEKCIVTRTYLILDCCCCWHLFGNPPSLPAAQDESFKLRLYIFDVHYIFYGVPAVPPKSLSD